MTGSQGVVYYRARLLSRDTEWGAEWSCPATQLDFCSLEAMCNYPHSCPYKKDVFGEVIDDILLPI